MSERSNERSRWAQARYERGIYKLTRQGEQPRYRVIYRVRGLGQRSKTFRALKEARDFQAAIRDPEKQTRLRLLNQGNVPLEDYFKLYVENGLKLNTLRPSTAERYSGILRLYVRGSEIGRRPVAELTVSEVEAWLTSLVDRGVGQHTVAKAHSTLRAVLGKAQREGKVLINPAVIKMKAPNERPPFFLTEEQVEAIAREIDDRYRTLVDLLAYTGLRIGEASALVVDDFDPLNGLLHVKGNSPEVAGVKHHHGTKTGKERVVTMPAFLCEELAEHIETYGIREADGSVDRGAFLFTTAEGKQVRQGNWRRRHFQAACKHVGVTRIRDGEVEVPRVHDLRHTAASLAAKAGYSLHEVKEMLGHASIKMTSDRYLHLFPVQRQELAEKLGLLAQQARDGLGKVIRLTDTSKEPDDTDETA
ncbi:MAG: site-specific integrase [Actinomycetota bacterium]